MCTTIRPTQLPFKDFYDYQGCATFVAQYLDYEELADPRAFPLYLPSPTTTLQFQRGDCFDYSTLLCSFLLGAGYDAYVVAGYASKRMTTKDEEKQLPPPLRIDDDEAPPVTAPTQTKYRVTNIPKLESRFLQAQSTSCDGTPSLVRPCADDWGPLRERS